MLWAFYKETSIMMQLSNDIFLFLLSIFLDFILDFYFYFSFY